MMQIFRLEGSFDPLSMVQTKAFERAEGTRLDVKAKVDTWCVAPWQQRVLAFIGPAGYGKSVMMAFLAVEGGLVSKATKGTSMFSTLKRCSQRLSGKKDSSKTNVTQTFAVGAAHMFKHDDVNTSSVRVCLLSIANQLALTVPGVKEELLKLNQSEVESITDLKVLFRSLLCAPMTRVKTPEHPTIVLLDALDEANVDEKGELVEIITTLWESETPQWLGVIVSSRPEGLIKDRFDNNVHKLQLESEENVKDLKLFLRQQLERCMKPEEDIGEAVNITLQQCDGLFLYASFLDKMLQDREDQSLALREIRTLVKELPHGLEEVYREYFARFLQQSLANNYHQYQTLLCSMVAARKPFDVQTVAALLELENQGAIETFLSRAENLLVFEGGRIQFVHKSMRDFLQDRRRAGRLAENEPIVGAKALGVSVDMGHKQLVKVLKANPRSPFALEHLIYHLCKRKEWESVREHLLDFDWVYSAVSMPDITRRLINDTDALYNYESFSDINVTDVIRAIELGRKAIEKDPSFLVFQLMGRIPDRNHPIITSLTSSEFANAVATNMYVPIRPTLESARSPLRKILEGHSDVVFAVAIDGDSVASGSRDKTVRLWDRKSGECLDVLEGHSGYVNAVAIDGDTVASGSYDKTLRLWDRQFGECLQVLNGHSSEVLAVAIDGDTVVSGSSDETVRLWDRRSGECLHVLEGHSGRVKAVAIDGDTVVSGSHDTTVRLWDRKSGECLQVLEGHSGQVNAVAIDGDIVVSGSSDKTVRLWDRESGEYLQVLEGHSNHVIVVTVDGDIVESGSWDQTVRLWDRKSGECLHTLAGYSFNENGVAIDGDTVVSGSYETVRLWDRQSDERLYLFEGHSAKVNSIAIDGDTVISGSIDKTVRLWDRQSGECLKVLKGHSTFVTSVAIDGDIVVSGSWDKTVRLWDRKSGECLQVLRGHSSYVNAVSIDGGIVVSGSWDTTVCLWDRMSGECLEVLEGHSNWVNAVAIYEDIVVSGSWDKTVRLWDRRSGRCLHVLEGHSDSVNAVAIGRDTVVSGSKDKTVRLWDRDSGECLHVLKEHSCSVTAVAIKRDTVVSGSIGQTVRLWDRKSGECLHVVLVPLQVVEVAVENVEGNIWIVFADESSRVPHLLAPLSTQLPN